MLYWATQISDYWPGVTITAANYPKVVKQFERYVRKLSEKNLWAFLDRVKHAPGTSEERVKDDDNDALSAFQIED